MAKVNLTITNNLEKIQRDFESVGKAAEYFGDKALGAAKQQQFLQRKMQSLIKQGVDPQSEGMKKLRADYDRVSKEVDSYNRKLKIQRGLQQAAIRSMNIATTAVAGMAAGFTALGVGAVRAAMGTEDAAAAFTPLVGGAEKAQKLVKMLNETAATTPFQFEGIASIATQLLPTMEGNLDKTVETFRMLGDTAGGNMDKLNRITLAYNTTLMKGVANTMELNTISKAGVPIFLELSKMMGKSVAEIRDMASKGQITGDIVTKVFTQMTSEGGIFYQGMQVASETLSGKLSTLKDNVSILAGEFGDQLLPSVKEIVDMMIGWIQSGEFDQPLQDFKTAAQDAFNYIKNNKDEILDTFSGIAQLAIEAAKALGWVGRTVGTIIQRYKEANIEAEIQKRLSEKQGYFWTNTQGYAEAYAKELKRIKAEQELIAGVETTQLGTAHATLELAKQQTAEAKKQADAEGEGTAGTPATPATTEDKEVAAIKRRIEAEMKANAEKLLLLQSYKNETKTSEQELQTWYEGILEKRRAKEKQAALDKIAEVQEVANQVNEILGNSNAMITEGLNAISQVRANIAEQESIDRQARAEAEKAQVDEATNEEIARLQKQYNAGLISTKKYNEKRKAIESKAADDKAKIDKKAQQEEQKAKYEAAVYAKKVNIANATITGILSTAQVALNAAVAIAKATAEGGIPLGIVVAAQMAALAGTVTGGIAGIAAAASSPLPAPPSAETGGRFVVPQGGGAAPDNVGLRVNEGETVDVLPRGEEPEQPIFVVQIGEEQVEAVVQRLFDDGRISIPAFALER